MREMEQIYMHIAEIIQSSIMIRVGIAEKPMRKNIQCRKGKKESPSAGTEGKSVPKKKTYYHVTTKEAVEQIIATGELKNGKYEVSVFAWTKQPTKRQARIAGISSDAQTVIKFETSVLFIADDGNNKKPISHIVVQTTEGERLPISISNIEIVEFKKAWWKFWKR